MTEMLHRRHRLQLDLEADDLPEIVHQLERIALDIEIEAAKGREQREVTSGGYSSGHHLTLVTDEEMTGDRYRAWLDEEYGRQRRARAAVVDDPQEVTAVPVARCSCGHRKGSHAGGYMGCGKPLCICMEFRR